MVTIDPGVGFSKTLEDNGGVEVCVFHHCYHLFVRRTEL